MAQYFTYKSLFKNILRTDSCLGVGNSNECSILVDLDSNNFSEPILSALVPSYNNSLFWNILRISHYFRIFCEPNPSSSRPNYNQSNTLAIRYPNYFCGSSLAAPLCSSRSASTPSPGSPLLSAKLSRLPDFLRLSTMNVYPHRWALPRNL